jgi:glycerol kinase
MACTARMRFTTDHVFIRLKWALENIPGLRAHVESGEAVLGTIDSWLIYNLTGGKTVAMETTNASSTGLYDPFNLEWNKKLCDLMDLPMEVLPEVRESSDDYGDLLPDLAGRPIPITGAAGDQQAALYGQCCFHRGDTKISQGSGAFVDINVGEVPTLSRRGLFPLIASKVNGKVKYLLEGYLATAGTFIDWLGRGLGLSGSPQELNDLANQAETTEGVVFVPAPAGIRYPHFDPYARAAVLGISLSTHRKHIARAVLEGIALSLNDIMVGIEEDTGISVRSVRVDGGVSRSDLLLQLLADYANKQIERAPEPDMTGIGAAYLAGLRAGFWDSEAELEAMRKPASVYSPAIAPDERTKKIALWHRAVERSLKWAHD